MKCLFKRKIATLALAGTLAITQTSCGIILHPSRDSETRGDLDVVAVLLDCCWLLVGVVPGVVALGIDFISGGAWHTKKLLALEPGEVVALRVAGRAPAACELSLRVVDASGRDLGPATRARVAQDERADRLSLAIPASVPSGAQLVLAVDGREQGRWAVAGEQ